MIPLEQKAILAIAIHAAFADGAKDEREREEVPCVADIQQKAATLDAGQVMTLMRA